MVTAALLKELLRELAAAEGPVARLRVAGRLSLALKELSRPQRERLLELLGVGSLSTGLKGLLDGSFFDSPASLVTNLIQRVESIRSDEWKQIVEQAIDGTFPASAPPAPPPPGKASTPPASESRATMDEGSEPEVSQPAVSAPEAPATDQQQPAPASDQIAEQTATPTPPDDANRPAVEQASPLREAPSWAVQPAAAAAGAVSGARATAALPVATELSREKEATRPAPSETAVESGDETATRDIPQGVQAGAADIPESAAPSTISDQTRATESRKDLLVRLARIRREAPSWDHRSLREALDSLGGGWAARRALSALIRERVLTDLDEALELIGHLDGDAARGWCLGDLLHSWPLDGGERRRVLAAAPSPAWRRRLSWAAARTG